MTAAASRAADDGDQGQAGCVEKTADCMVGSTCTCTWAAIGIMFLFLIITNMTISAQLADDCVMDDGSDCPSFPSSDNGGFRDRGDTHSLRMDAMTYALEYKTNVEQAAGSANCPGETAAERTKRLEDGDGCSVNTESAAQTESMRRWSLIILFKRKAGKSILEPAIIAKLQAVIAKLQAVPQYDSYCLKVQADTSWSSSNASAYECAQPVSPMQWLMPTSIQATVRVTSGSQASQCLGEAASNHSVPALQASLLKATVGAYSAGKEVFTGSMPPALKSLFSDCLGRGLAQTTGTTLLFDGKGSAPAPCTASAAKFSAKPFTSCNPNNPLDCMLSAAPCSSGWCSCEASAPAAGALDATLSVMRSAKYPLFMFGKTFESTLKTDVMSVTIKFGSPLIHPDTGKKYKNAKDDEKAQTKLFEDWAKKHFKPVLDDEMDFEDVEGLYLLPIISFAEILNVLMHDGLLAIGSIVFVFFYLAFHSGSFFLAAAGMLHVMMSFPLAFVIYRHVFGIVPFYPLAFLSIYVILAIGADDIFVFVDAWRQSALAGPLVNKDLSTRMAWVFRRAAKAMLITSLTTFGAFSITAISPLNEVATFGLFTALLVLANYIFVITFFPVVVLTYHRYFENKKCCCCHPSGAQLARTPEPPTARYCFQSKPNGFFKGARANEVVAMKPLSAAPMPLDDGKPIMPNKPVPAADTEAAPQAVAAQEVPEPAVQKVFRTKIVPWFVERSLPKYVSVALLSIMAIGFAFGAVQLGPTTKEDQLLPEWHKFQRIINMFNNDFGQGQETPMKMNNLVWGFNKDVPMDRAGVSRYDASMAGNGKVMWDSTFDLADPAAQLHVAKACDTVWSAKEGGVAVVRQGGGLQDREVNCFLVGFRQWRQAQNLSFPAPKAQFTSSLQLFLEQRANATRDRTRKFSPHEQYQDMVMIDQGKVRWAMVQCNTTLGRWAVNYELIKSAYDAWETWAARTNAAAPNTAANMFSSSPARSTAGAWVFMNTQELLVSGAVVGAACSAAFAFVVLSVSTLNPFVSLIALLNIAGIVSCILGMMYVLGWEMGVIESVSITVLVGLSVDYVVHLANSYIEATDENGKELHARGERVAAAWQEMGITVFGGAVTSLGASGMLFLCYFQQFFKFGGFMFMTIFGSFLWANFFFMPFLAFAGPEGDYGSIKHLIFKRPAAKPAAVP